MEKNYDRPRFVLTVFNRLVNEEDSWKNVDFWKVVEPKRAECKARIAWPNWCYVPVRLAGEAAADCGQRARRRRGDHDRSRGGPLNRHTHEILI